jgi:glycosyltransferase involved in cell wall biosynthesis
MPERPRFSIALCTYNGARFLSAQFDSYLAQSRPPDELVVCDDQSSDCTIGMIDEFAKQAPFPVVVHRQPVNLGSNRNFSDAVSRCRGEWIFLSDQDDVWLPHKLAAFERTIERHGEARLIASDAAVVNDELNPIAASLWQSLLVSPALCDQLEKISAARLLSRRNLITGATLAFHRSLVPLIVPIPAIWFHDAWIALLATAIAPCALIREPLIQYRQHAEQQVGGAALTLSRQLALARRLDRTYFENQAAFFEEMLTRLSNRSLRDAELVDHLRDKIAFSRFRGEIRTRNRLVRAAMVLAEGLKGSYHRHAQGFKAMLADAVL